MQSVIPGTHTGRTWMVQVSPSGERSMRVACVNGGVWKYSVARRAVTAVQLTISICPIVLFCAEPGHHGCQRALWDHRDTLPASEKPPCTPSVAMPLQKDLGFPYTLRHALHCHTIIKEHAGFANAAKQRCKHTLHSSSTPDKLSSSSYCRPSSIPANTDSLINMLTRLFPSVQNMP